ncbi:MAG: hypothetical protein ABS84_07050 [Rubrivivax sp. SCN 71-131]|jgi:hypothetical protein|nr:MAG: hypothetical protein ABS84_07050 [Rubrivivax sp. SCN 71-131]
MTPLPLLPLAPGRRRWLQRTVAAALAMRLAPGARAAAPAAAQLDVWKDPNCGCCGDWIAHMREHGFAVTVHDSGNTAMRKRLGIALQYGSCHTAWVGGYAIEGHVPAREVQRLLRQRPRALGLAVPGMPVGSPGMDGEVYGGRRDPYDVLLLDAGGGASVFQAYR